MTRAVVLVILLLPSSLVAQQMAPRATDIVLDKVQMQAEVIGQTHEFYDGGQSFFSISGSYSYTYPDGGIAYGRWEMPQEGRDGIVCTFFRHGFARCDRYVRAGARLVLITEDNLRFPVRRNSAGD